VSKKGVRIIHE